MLYYIKAYYFNLFCFLLTLINYAQASISINTPMALHQLIHLDNNVNTQGNVIRLKGIYFDKRGSELTYIVSRLPLYGTLYQLSNVYSLHGYNPVSGIKITSNYTVVTGSSNRVYYVPNNQYSINMRADVFSFIVTDGTKNSFEGNITIVDSQGIIIASNFLLGNDKWTIVGNKEPIIETIYDPSNRGNNFNHYIYGSENLVNINKYGETDKSLWFFNAPSKFLGNIGIAYGGDISFSISVLAGDINHLNRNVNLIELECKQCGYKNGITIGYPLTKLSVVNNLVVVKIALLETSNWIKVLHNGVNKCLTPSKCEFLQVLSRLSGFRILGDLTNWYETIALDNVYISNTHNNIPLCAMGRPDASVCDCDK